MHSYKAISRKTPVSRRAVLFLVEPELYTSFLGHLFRVPGRVEGQIYLDILYLIEFHDLILDFFLDLTEERTADSGEGHGDGAGTIL